MDLDPQALLRPVPEPGSRDFIICGAPRTGTSLLAAMLFQPPEVITVLEPWAGMRLAPRELFRSIREEIDTTGMLSHGKLDLPALEENGSVRWVREGKERYPVRVEPDYLLGIKWPTYWQYLELLGETKFLVCLRHPVEVVASFKRTGGRLAEGQSYDVAFDRELNSGLRSATRDLSLRRILMYEHIHTRILPYLDRANVMQVRYERWFTDPEGLMTSIASFLGTSLNTGPAVLKRPPRADPLTDRERDSISALCVSAKALGYSV
jgi:hypothetical protein